MVNNSKQGNTTNTNLMGISNEIEGVHTENEGVRVGVGKPHKLHNNFSNPDFPDSDNFLIDWDKAKLKIFIPKISNPDIFDKLKNYYGEDMGKKKGGKKC